MDIAEKVVLTDQDEAPIPFAGVYAYWMDKHGQAWAPSLSKFRLDELESRILPWSIIVDVEPNAGDFLYRFWGSQRTTLIGVEMTGKRVSDIPDANMRKGNLQEYLEVQKLKKPLLCNTPVTTKPGIEVTFQSIRLPLTNDGVNVTHIYSAINYEQISAAHYRYYGTNPEDGLSRLNHNR